MNLRNCTYSLDGEHHFGPRQWKDYGEVIACRCGLRANEAEERATREAMAATTAERRRQRDLSRAQVKKAMEQSGREFAKQQPKLDL